MSELITVPTRQTNIILPTGKKPMTIKIVKRKRKGVEYFSFQFSKAGKILNHSYDRKSTCKRQLAKFLDDIKTGNYEIK